jgi:hypothetical protein
MYTDRRRQKVRGLDERGTADGLLDEYGAAVRSVGQDTLLPPATELDNAAAAAVTNPALPTVDTVSDDDSVLAGDATCATSADNTSVITQRPIVWDIRVVKSDVPMHPQIPFLTNTLRRLVSLVCTSWRKSMRSYPIPTTRLSTVSIITCCLCSTFTSRTLLQPITMIWVFTRSRRSLLLASGSWTPTRQCYKGISIDFGFLVQSSKDSKCVRRLSGLHDDTCYVLLHDHFSNVLYGAAVRRLSGLHNETCYVLLRYHFNNALCGAAVRRLSGLHGETYRVLLRGHFHTKDAMRWNHSVHNGPN